LIIDTSDKTDRQHRCRREAQGGGREQGGGGWFMQGGRIQNCDDLGPASHQARGHLVDGIDPWNSHWGFTLV